MYKHLEKADIQRVLQVSADYRVDGLLITGTHPKEKEYPHLYEALQKIAPDYHEEKIATPFFGDIKSIVVDGKRIWFDVVYGTAYLSEVAHVACMLGSQANILLGTCGALRSDLNTSDTLLPYASFGNESSTRMYQRENNTNMHASHAKLCAEIKKSLVSRAVVDEGKLVTVQAMLAETKDDVDIWAAEGYSGVDMESATLFAVSNHFRVPSAALLFVADNLVRRELIGDIGYETLRTQRMMIRKENYEIALSAILTHK